MPQPSATQKSKVNQVGQLRSELINDQQQVGQLFSQIYQLNKSFKDLTQQIETNIYSKNSAVKHSAQHSREDQAHG